ncbi:MAG: GNAT family N-acetyltransferase [Phycisphaerales bacterium]|nr:GNAT family N-acetyltransferase [Phycisphaerales bacterium]
MPRCANETETGLGLGWTPPEPFVIRFETARLVIRAYELGDAAQMFEAVSASREHLLPWMPWAREGHRDVEASVHYITTQIMAVRDAKTFSAVGIGIFDRASGRLLGGTGVHGVHRDTACAETGYWIRADATRRGYCTEATAGVLSWAFRGQSEGGLGMRRVVIYCSGENIASRRVPEKLGCAPR